MEKLTENYKWTDLELRMNKNDKHKDFMNINDIIGVKVYPSKVKDVIHIFTIEKLKRNKLTQKVLKFTGEKDICRTFVSGLETRLKSLTARPRRLLVLLSPISGSQKSEKIYKKSVAPLFEIANITTEVIVSERHEHVLDIVSSYPIETVDGIVVCGGDGSFSQCMNGVFEKTQKAANINYNDPDIKLKPTTVPIGIIPTGTFNVGAKFCNGCSDIKTAVLAIIKGSTSKLGILNLYADCKWIKSSFQGIAHGTITEFFFYADNFRWLKTARYMVLLPYYILFKKHPRFHAALTLVSSDIECDTKVGKTKTKEKSVECMEGTYVDVLVDCHEHLSPNSYIGSSRWFTDHALLSVFKKCGRLKLMKNNLDMLSKGDDYVRPEFITFKTITGYKIKIENTNMDHSNGRDSNVYRLIADGEKLGLQTPEWELRLHEPLVKIFSSLAHVNKL